MAKTLKEFLEERARRDFASAEVIHDLTSSGIAFDWRLRELNKNAKLLRHFDSPALDDISINISAQGLDRVSSMLLSIAGEAVKKLEDQVPDIHKRIPGFPWAHFKRYRDINVKLGQTLTDGKAIDAVITELNREIEKINSLGTFDSQDPKYLDLPYFKLICTCLNWAGAVDSFAKSSKVDPVSLNPGPALKELSDKLGMPQHAIPMFLESNASRDVLHSMHEQLKQPSLFFRKAHPKLYDKSQLEKLKTLRNKYAHFEDYFDADARSPKDSYFLDITTFDETEFKTLVGCYHHISRQMTRVTMAKLYGESQQYAQQLAREYEQIVLGTAQNDPTKRALMDDAVSRIIRSGIRPRNADALVIAMGSLLQQATVEEVKDVIKYVEERKNKLNKPSELLDDLNGHTKLFQVNVQRFVEHMQTHLGITANTRSIP